MKYGILVNPVAGNHDIDKKRVVLDRISNILEDCVVVGLDTTNSEEFSRCAKDLSEKVEVLVTFGGDGTFSDTVNSVDESVILSHIPTGTGNILRCVFNYPRNSEIVAQKIKQGEVHLLDLIKFNQRKAFIASIGLDGHILNERKKQLQLGKSGINSYITPTIQSVLRGYKSAEARINVDGSQLEIPRLLSLVVTKVPYYGYGLKVVPDAEFNDGLLHVLAVESSRFKFLIGLVSSSLGRNIVGSHLIGRNVQLKTGRELYIQTDGDLRYKSDYFEFKVLPKSLRMKY